MYVFTDNFYTRKSKFHKAQPVKLRDAFSEFITTLSFTCKKLRIYSLFSVYSIFLVYIFEFLCEYVILLSLKYYLFNLAVGCKYVDSRHILRVTIAFKILKIWKFWDTRSIFTKFLSFIVTYRFTWSWNIRNWTPDIHFSQNYTLHADVFIHNSRHRFYNKMGVYT